jgi:hypothetical protein
MKKNCLIAQSIFNRGKKKSSSTMFRTLRAIAKKFFLQHTFQGEQVRKDYEILNNVTQNSGRGISGIKSSPEFYPSGNSSPASAHRAAPPALTPEKNGSHSAKI